MNNTARRSLTGISRLGIASLAIGLLGALSGCFNPTPPANVLCAPDGWCPSGQTCDPNRWQCVPDGQIPDAGGWPWYDSGWPWPPPDSYYPWPDAGAGEGIAAALAAPWGPVYIRIDQVLVTYIKPFISPEPEGFFVQADPYGPAMFLGMSPSFSGVRLAAGDRVSFTVYEMGGLYDNSIAFSIGELVVHSRGNDVSALVQDVNEAFDLTSDARSYASELVRADLVIQGDFYDDGYGYRIAQVATYGISGDWALMVRLSSPLLQEVGLEPGCTFRLDGVPLWRYWSEAIFPVHDFSELRDVSCTPPRIRTAVADSNTTVQLELSRNLDPATVQADGSQFTIDDLLVTAAAVDGRFVTLTTAPQTPGQFYSLEVAATVRDIFGAGADQGSAPTFQGAAPRARLRINELKANIVPSCDLLELRVTEGGTLSDVRITEQGATIHTFSNLQVATNDIIVIHFNRFSTQCNPRGSPSETQSVSQHARVDFGANFDTAYDIYVTEVGLGTTPHTIGALDHRGRLLDIVLVAGSPALAPDGDSEQDAALAAEAGEWRTQSGSVPPGGFTGDAFTTHAAAGLDAGEVSIVNGWGALDGRPSVQRSSNADSNHNGDWTTAPHSFGLLNPGQSPF
jgi:hypothetical protein